MVVDLGNPCDVTRLPLSATTTTMADGALDPFRIPSCGLTLPSQRSRYQSGIEDSPELPVSILPLSSDFRDSSVTPGPFLGPTQARRQPHITQISSQSTFDSWNFGQETPEVRIYSPSDYWPDHPTISNPCVDLLRLTLPNR